MHKHRKSEALNSATMWLKVECLGNPLLKAVNRRSQLCLHCNLRSYFSARRCMKDKEEKKKAFKEEFTP